MQLRHSARQRKAVRAFLWMRNKTRKTKENCNGHEDVGFVAKNGRGIMHAEHNLCLDFLFDSKKATAGLDDVEPKVLLRTVDSGSIPEFGSGLSEEQLPLMVFVLSNRADVGDKGDQHIHRRYSSCACRYLR